MEVTQKNQKENFHATQLYDPWILTQRSPHQHFTEMLAHQFFFFAAMLTTAEPWISLGMAVWNIHKTECYPAIKKNKIMFFAGKWMQLETITLHEINQTQTNMCSLNCAI